MQLGVLNGGLLVYYMRKSPKSVGDCECDDSKRC